MTPRHPDSGKFRGLSPEEASAAFMARVIADSNAGAVGLARSILPASSSTVVTWTPAVVEAAERGRAEAERRAAINFLNGLKRATD